MNTILGRKKEQAEKFLEDGLRIPVTLVEVIANPVVSIKTKDKDGYTAVQLGYGIKKNADKAKMGHVKGAKLEKAPLFLREVRMVDGRNLEELSKVGDLITAEMVLAPGDVINVTGISKGKGFAGGVKRHQFKGGPRTHGQSDRERAPGSIGQTTTPGRVYKGKRMAGKMGNEQVTVKNLQIVEVGKDYVLIKGLVPGILGGLVKIKKVGEKKKFTPLLKKEVKEEKVEEKSQEVENKTEEVIKEEK